MSTPQASLTFRKATPADIPILLPLIRTAYRGNKGWTNESALLNDKRISPDALLAKITRPSGFVLVATRPEDPATVIACCEVELQPGAAHPTGYFGLFAVDPAIQGGGIGKQVLAKAEEHAREEWNAAEMEMCVIWTRSELIDYYVRRGYKHTGEKKPFPYAEVFEGAALRDDLHFIVLRKPLAVAAAA
ncbi:alpha/beta hydrolase [Plectosphaerella cucumerina]|uniref:Alpha/beta hydrolase n=1 Tax=Plectosphaerella cucumerina TaxID=40658 RepID=A0A8K0TBW0_9PEZI|nr:alpha/beta hydrolase [Plectosphaerella cucumerina]